MERAIQEKKALEQIVSKLLESVLEQEKRIGYIYWRHNETTKNKN
jgi:hypothetical protein